MERRDADEAAQARPRFVYWMLAIGVLSLASSAILIRLAAEAPALAIATWRTGIAVVLLAPFALRRVPELRRLSRRDWRFIACAGVVLGLHFVTWIESLYHTTVASSTVLVTTSPIFIAILGYIFLRERLAPRVVWAIVISIAGSVLIALGDAAGENFGRGSDPLLGNSLALSAALLVSIYLLIGRVARQTVSWLGYVFPLYTVASATVILVALVRDVPLFGYSTVFYVLCASMAIFPQIIGHGSFNYALKYVPAAILGILTLVEPVIASLAAFLLFGEVPYWMAFLGMVLVLTGVALAIIRRTPRVARFRRGQRTGGVGDR